MCTSWQDSQLTLEYGPPVVPLPSVYGLYDWLRGRNAPELVPTIGRAFAGELILEIVTGEREDGSTWCRVRAESGKHRAWNLGEV
jgi:hypothetical protein